MWYESKIENGKGGITYFWNKETRQTRWDTPPEGYVSIEQQQQQAMSQGDDDVNKQSRPNEVNDQERTRRLYPQQRQSTPQANEVANKPSRLNEENNQEQMRGQYALQRQGTPQPNEVFNKPSRSNEENNQEQIREQYAQQWQGTPQSNKLSRSNEENSQEQIRDQYVEYVRKQQGRPQWDEYNRQNQVKDQERIKRQYADQVHHQGEDQPLSSVLYHPMRDDANTREGKVYSFEAEPNYGVLTGIKVKFKQDPFPQNLLHVMSENEATKLRDTFNDLFLAQRTATLIVHLMCWSWLLLVILATVLFLTLPRKGNDMTHIVWFLGVLFGSMPLFLIIACCIDCVCCKSGNTKKNVTSFVANWNRTNANRGLELRLNDGFWDSVYPKHISSKFTLGSDIAFYKSLPNMYIHLYKTAL